MKASANAYAIIKYWEKFSDHAYQRVGDRPTIGWGNTFWEDGRPVVLGETIDLDRAEALLKFFVERTSLGVYSLTKNLTQGQFDALVSFSYNLGVNAFKNSTLLKKINVNSSDQTIWGEFLLWDKIKGKSSTGLLRRRNSEANLYFKNTLNYFENLIA